MAGLTVKAQETFFPTKKGTVLVYNTFDKKNKLTNKFQYTIEKVNVNGPDLDITYLVQSMDQKDKLLYNDEITINQRGDKLYLDMSNMVNKAAFQQEGEMPANIEVTGNNMEIPVNPNPGDILPDASVAMALKLGFINMKVSADVTNRKIEAIEDISVAAGTFNTFKLTSNVNASALGIKSSTKNLEWYAKGIGIIKSEAYDNKGNLQSRTELVELKN